MLNTIIDRNQYATMHHMDDTNMPHKSEKEIDEVVNQLEASFGFIQVARRRMHDLPDKECYSKSEKVFHQINGRIL